MLHEQTLILGQVNDLLIQERSLTVTGGGHMQKIPAAAHTDSEIPVYLLTYGNVQFGDLLRWSLTSACGFDSRLWISVNSFKCRF